MTGEFLRDAEIIAMRLHQDDMENILVGFTAGNGGNNEASQEYYSKLSPNCTIIIAAFVTLAVVAMALIVLARPLPQEESHASK